MMISLNTERIEALSRSLSAIPLPPDFGQKFVPPLTASDEISALVLLCVAAICHSTKGGLSGQIRGRTLKGTEYLLEAFCATANQDPDSVSLQGLKDLDETGLRRLLTRFIDRAEVTLSDLDRRAEILRELAQEIETIFAGSVLNLLDQTGHRVGGPEGFYEQMEKCSAFRDPLKKKSGVFLYFLEVSGRWHVVDPDQIIPMIDYHVIRLLCRTVCIEITSPALREKLLKKEQVTPEEEREVRETAMIVRQRLAQSFDTPARGELLYLLGRSYCRHAPICVSGAVPENDSFNLYTGVSAETGCPFQAWCPGACQSAYRDLWEPFLPTESY